MTTLNKVLPGKSLHAELLFERPLDPREPAQEALRLRIQRLLIALTRGDPAIINRNRLMRAGGVPGVDDQLTLEKGLRIQTLLRAEEVAFPAEVVEGRLSRLCQSRWGWHDDKHLKTALDVLRCAGSLRRSVKVGNKDAQRLQHQMRDTITWPKDQDDAELLEHALEVLSHAGRLSKYVREGNEDARRLQQQLWESLSWPTDRDDAELLKSLTGWRKPRPREADPGRGFTKTNTPTAPGAAQSRWDARTVQWEPLLTEANLWMGTNRRGWYDISCPFPHGSEDKLGGTGVTPPYDGRPAGFNCFHASCAGRNVHDLMLFLEEELGEDVVGKYAKLKGAHLPPDFIAARRVFRRWTGRGE